ncbi:hypothetical protein NFI96_032632, partial [Prochilodus magdalenae]
MVNDPVNIKPRSERRMLRDMEEHQWHQSGSLLLLLDLGQSVIEGAAEPMAGTFVLPLLLGYYFSTARTEREQDHLHPIMYFLTSTTKLLIPLLVLQLLGNQTCGEVVPSFKVSCPEFFIEDPEDQNIHYPPTVLSDPNNPQRYQQICQRFDNAYRYATLYDTRSRIPVYSAYYYVGYHKVTTADWKIEPQLDDPNLGPDMAREETVEKHVRGKNQALYDDYVSPTSQYTRGHLYPRCYSDSQQCAIATYTHTNAVPQTQEDNNRWGHKAETAMRKIIDGKCENASARVVTGAVP